MGRRNGFFVALGALVTLGAVGAHAEPKSPTIWLPVAWDQVPANYRERIAPVIRSPTMVARSGSEEFNARRENYRWLLDHPENVSAAWRRLEIHCVPIQLRPDGSFRWEDDKGTCLDWRTVVDTEAGRVWYAEGRVHAGALMPTVQVKAVAVMHHDFRTNERGLPVVVHQVEIYLHADSTAANLIARMLGPAAPRLAETGAKQLLLFFAGIGRYVESYPREAPALLAPPKG